jgi:DNA helicase-2/ATP-dependent DNA helicase PcrA
MSDLLSPRPHAERRRAHSLLDVTLDPAQRAAVALPAGRALLVLGEAGHGKTTVALHRLAHLWRAARASHEPLRAAVIVPTEGLARLVQPLLRRLGVDVEARTYDRWAATQARRAFRDVPRRESESTPPSVARVKRDPAVRTGLAELARHPPGRIDDDVDAPRVRSRALARRADLQHLFGDRLLLEVIARASGAIPPRAIDAVLEHTRVQFSPTTEEEWAHVTDRQRLVAVDRRALDEGTATGDAGTVDVEDYAVLFELDRLRGAVLGGRAAAPRLYDALIVDEAQELAPLELTLLGRSVAPGGTLVVAGDADQQTGATGTFLGWDATMREIGWADHATVQLDVGYRCPPGVVALARSILGAPASRAAGGAAARGVDPSYLAFPSEQTLAADLGRAMRTLLRQDPRASIAVICRSPLTARRLAPLLSAEVSARLVFDGRFLARGPAQVTTVDEVKGLEFDVVVVPDATSADYPDTPTARRALYVAVTRARHQVVLAGVGERTRIA